MKPKAEGSQLNRDNKIDSNVIEWLLNRTCGNQMVLVRARFLYSQRNELSIAQQWMKVDKRLVRVGEVWRETNLEFFVDLSTISVHQGEIQRAEVGVEAAKRVMWRRTWRQQWYVVNQWRLTYHIRAHHPHRSSGWLEWTWAYSSA